MQNLKTPCLASIVTSLILTTLAGCSSLPAPQQNRSDAPDNRSQADTWASETLSKMTPDERLSLLRGKMVFRMPKDQWPQGITPSAGFLPGIPHLGIPPLVETDASLGVANMGGFMRQDDVATALPSGAAMAASWNPALMEKAGVMIGAEARAKGFNVMLAGGVNLVREPRNGRNFEYLGEDPLLAGVMAGRQIRGIQSNHMISTVKHYAFNDQETGRMIMSVNLDEAAQRESDLLAFEIAIEIGNPGSVMCGYNRINGVYACENTFLLNRVLRNDWGYKGWVMSDWGAVHTPSIREGLDQESGTGPGEKPYFGAMLKDALKAGDVTQADIDQSASRILRSMYSHGLVDHPITHAAIDYNADADIAQAMAEEGIVLLKNQGNLLPLSDTAKRILVVGGHADKGVPAGGGSSQVYPAGGPSLTLAKPGAAYYAKRLYMPSAPVAALREVRPDARVSYDDGTDPARAAKAAKSADIVVVFAEQFTSEGYDAPTLSLPGKQDALIATVAAANPNTVVVLETGGPVLMPWIDQVNAVVAAWYAGQRGGEAIARVLSGEVNPSGKLAMTFPRSTSQLPNPKLPGLAMATAKPGSDIYQIDKSTRAFDVTYPEGADVGYRWYDHSGFKPLFAFGHGLSYTRFTYRDLAISNLPAPAVSFTLNNSGKRQGAEVAQLYATVDGVRRLVGWSKVSLKPGETRNVSITIAPRLLADFDVDKQNWVIAAGSYKLEVSSAVDQPRLTGNIQLQERRIKP